MKTRRLEEWEEAGSRSTTRASNLRTFINQYVSPLFFGRTNSAVTQRACRDIVTEEQFWRVEDVLPGAVRLRGFRLTDWFPRAPGLYWSQYAERARSRIWSNGPEFDPELGSYFSPGSKGDFVAAGGIGTIRLRPRLIDGERCWLTTALTGTACHGGIPLAIPDTLREKSGVKWGDQCNLLGRVKFLQDVGLDDVASSVHHARPLIVFIESLEVVTDRPSTEPLVITPVALIVDASRSERGYPQYSFVHCKAGSDTELDAAAEWIEKYASKYARRVITNFDEQRPILADVPLSYQRLTSNTCDQNIVNRFAGADLANRIDQVREPTTNTIVSRPCSGRGQLPNVLGFASLRSALANLYGDVGKATVIVADAGVNRQYIDLGGSPQVMWQMILDEAVRSGKLADLVKVALESYPDNSALIDAATALGLS